MVEVFKTNVNCPDNALRIVKALSEHLPHAKINFDLQDVDNILRIEADCIANNAIVGLMNEMCYECEVLPD